MQNKFLLTIFGSLLGFFISQVNATLYPMPDNGDDLIGENLTIQVQSGDSIDQLMQKYEVSYHELLEANPKVRFSKLKMRTQIIIPLQHVLPEYREGIVVNIPELRLYYFMPDQKRVFTTTVGLGRTGWRTPTMKTYIVKKEADPVWHVPDSIAEYSYQTTGKILPSEIPPGPDNPLGGYALYLKEDGYLMHGTNNQATVGKYFSSGCMRLYASAIEFLYNEVKVGTPVYIVHHINKAGWMNNVLYLESHVPVDFNDRQQTILDQKDLNIAIAEASQKHQTTLDWQKINLVARQQIGVPEPIGVAN